MKGSAPARTTIKPSTAQANKPRLILFAQNQRIGMLYYPFKTSTTLDTRPDSAPTERSMSPLVSGTSSASVKTNSTAWEPKMFEKLATERNFDGFATPKPMIMSTHASGKRERSKYLATMPRAPLHTGVAGSSAAPVEVVDAGGDGSDVVCSLMD